MGEEVTVLLTSDKSKVFFMKSKIITKMFYIDSGLSAMFYFFILSKYSISEDFT